MASNLVIEIFGFVFLMYSLLLKKMWLGVSERRCARVYAGVHGCTRVCVCGWVCAGMGGCAWVLLGVCRCCRVCAGLCGCEPVCGCVWVGVGGCGQLCWMNFQNFFWRIESLHQRTLIHILYEFLNMYVSWVFVQVE